MLKMNFALPERNILPGDLPGSHLGTLQQGAVN